MATEYPTKPALLRHLYDGGTTKEYLEKHGENRGLLTGWKRRDKEFAKKFAEASCTNPNDRYPDWQDKFLAAYAGLKKKASIAAAHHILVNKHKYEITLGAIYEHLSASDRRYDLQFAQRFTHHEAQRLSNIEAKLYDQMEEGAIPSIAYKHLQSHQLTRDRFKEAPKEVKIDSTQHRIEERRVTLRAEFVERSHRMFGKEVKDVSRIESNTAEVVSGEAEVECEPSAREEAREPETKPASAAKS